MPYFYYIAMFTRNVHIIQNTFFLSLMGMVCFVITRPYDALDPVFKKHYLVEEQRSIAYVKDYISLKKFEMNQPGAFDKILPYYTSMVYVDSATQQLFTYIDTIHRPIKADSLQTKIERYASELLATIPQDSSAFSPYLFEIRNTPSQKSRDGKWLNCLLRGQSYSNKELIILALRSDIYAAEKIVVRRLVELSHARCLRYDTVFVLTASPKQLWNIGDKVTNYLAPAILNRYDGLVSFHCDGKPIPGKRGMAVWNNTTKEPGDYTVHGYIAHNSEERFIWDTLPWSFQYRVVAKGISLVHGAGQTCYRQGSHPITVSIPGYTPDKIRLRAKGANFINNGNGHWSFTLTDKHCDNIIVYADAIDSRGHTSTVHAAKFPVINMPALAIGIDGTTASTINAPDLLHRHQLTVLTEQGEPSPDLAVAGYKLCIINANNKLLGDYTIAGNKLDGNSSAITAACKELSAGAHLYITDVLVKDNAGEVLPASSLGIAVQ
ncbi:hypothetical protein CJD36_011145 [Flavipsychrobacter stenotrophus]|uniref:Gliding motility-associated protein GldM C-terminal domain-containing protein n=1 Tax=Flavipsychrobacter stenotrophus TaxID=2077091 RepID=A0A2S7SUF0_9BACT|nr:hypothetical protein [Flavipsychrobacter stenotrophus]PQJ10523.1 hypothetical protein CJD36_011145 [Flavipsychrobacter stenotrophus]